VSGLTCHISRLNTQSLETLKTSWHFGLLGGGAYAYLSSFECSDWEESGIKNSCLNMKCMSENF